MRGFALPVREIDFKECADRRATKRFEHCGPILLE
jgi:hypothetical protein